MANNIPSRNPSASGDIVGTIELVLRKHALNQCDMLPARVLKHDRKTNRVELELLIQQVTTGGEILDRAIVASVPVYRFGCSDYIISTTIKPQTLGWIKANDRDISTFLKTLEKSPPVDGRIHDFSSGLFFADSMKADSTTTAEHDGLIIKKTDDSVSIELSQDKLRIFSKDSVIVDCQNATVNAEKTATINTEAATINATETADINTKTATITATSGTSITTPKATFSKDVEIKGKLKTIGDTTLAGLTAGVSKLTSANIGGIEFGAHTHTSSAPGSPTSPPQ